MKLVLLPGLDGTGRLFEPFLRALPLHLSPVIISYPTDQRLSYAELVRLVRQQVPVDEDYVLLAESFSGPLAIEIAANILAIYTKEAQDPRITRDNEQDTAIRSIARAVWQHYQPENKWSPPAGAVRFSTGPDW